MYNKNTSKDAIFTGRYDADGKLTITYSDFFNIDGKTINSSGCGETLEEARSIAYKCAKLLAKEQNTGDYCTSAQHTSFKEEMNGGGSKPISDKQQHVIIKMASELGLNAEREAHASYGKSLGALQGAEAHQLIQKLKAKKGEAYAV